MTEAELAALLRALAFEAAVLQELLHLCAAAGRSSASVSRPLVERTIGDLQALALQAEALSPACRCEVPRALAAGPVWPGAQTAQQGWRCQAEDLYITPMIPSV